ncbi:MAG: 2-amino-4-hydroxy-6-hydroxymethyldihydropteridine diphosphokinase [Treponema sp.]|jgi:2-amino-4-hydroxy-6-hydroxymethyldihydropteridine diphosphokinase|nr:2-amino-4-hydroxy-6-hydroxymethyldihydropteridine diphosphokinase [Treponema sp.]
MKNLVVLGLGSNRGDSAAILTGAIGKLRQVLEDLRVASLIETEPLYVKDQPRFLNTAASGFFSRSPWELLTLIHSIETSYGRDRSRERRWGERTLDIDILLFGDQIISAPPVLEIPHPRLNERLFALKPLLELFPGARDPLTGRPFREILRKII